jgi:hypothetical protein
MPACMPSSPPIFVEKWDWRNQHVEEVVASTSVLLVGRAVFEAASEQYPGAQLTLRQGIRVIEKAPNRLGAVPAGRGDVKALGGGRIEPANPY